MPPLGRPGGRRPPRGPSSHGAPSRSRHGLVTVSSHLVPGGVRQAWRPWRVAVRTGWRRCYQRTHRPPSGVPQLAAPALPAAPAALPATRHTLPSSPRRSEKRGGHSRAPCDWWRQPPSCRRKWLPFQDVSQCISYHGSKKTANILKKKKTHLDYVDSVPGPNQIEPGRHPEKSNNARNFTRLS